MKKGTRLALTVAFIVLFQLLAILIWCQAFFTWPETEDFPPQFRNTLIRLITIIIWIWIAIVLGVLVKRWYYVLALTAIPLFKTILSPYGFDIMRTYSISQIAADEERLNHVMSSLSGLIVLSVLLVMLVLRLCILDPMEKQLSK
jgi:hypothetical protein